MELTQFKVNGLFGRFDHTITLGREGGINVITAPNGYGKTQLLQLVDCFFSKKFERMLNSNFNHIDMKFSGHKGVKISKSTQEDREGKHMRLNRVMLAFTARGFGGRETWKYVSQEIMRDGLFPSFINQIDVDVWEDERDGEILTDEDMVERFGFGFDGSSANNQNIPDWLTTLITAHDCHFVKTQRLQQEQSQRLNRHHRHFNRVVQTVDQNEKDLVLKLTIKIREYANKSQQLDQSFPRRVLSGGKKDVSEQDILKNKLTQLQNKRAELVKVGILSDDENATPIGPSLETEWNIDIRRMLSIYVEDTESKLSVLDDIFDKISLFRNIINNQFHYKTMGINVRKGIVFSNDKGEQIPVSGLSSGEQHELILIYDLLFNVKDKALILIDEPELSLHVAWQFNFIPNLRKIRELRPFQTLIATHSPQIINGNWDIVDELGKIE